jgi:hypothetical protein
MEVSTGRCPGAAELPASLARKRAAYRLGVVPSRRRNAAWHVSGERSPFVARHGGRHVLPLATVAMGRHRPS